MFTKGDENMSSALLSLLISHILTYVEQELVRNEPALVQDLINDVNSLINKLEALIASKNASIAAVVNPVLSDVAVIADNVIDAGGAVAAQGVQTPQSVN